VGALLIEFVAEAVELALLSAKIAGRQAGGFRFEGTMHAFVPAVLLRFARFDEFRQHTQPDPPGGQTRVGRR
jgi:hypothetical protein